MPRKGRKEEVAKPISYEQLTKIRGELAYFIGEMDRLLKLMSKHELTEISMFSLTSGVDRGLKGMRSFIGGINKSYGAIVSSQPIVPGQLTERSTAKRRQRPKTGADSHTEQVDEALVLEAKSVADGRGTKKLVKKTRNSG